MSDLDPNTQAADYRHFFYNTEAGKMFMDMLQSQETRYLHEAERTFDINLLAKASGVRSVIEAITSVIDQVPDQSM